MQEIDEKDQLLIKAIDIAINASIFIAKFCLKSVLKFNKEYKKAQMRARRFKKVWKKDGTTKSLKKFRLV